MNALIAPKVLCPNCFGQMYIESPDSTDPNWRDVKDWTVYCNIVTCPNFMRRFKQPIQFVELTEA